MTPGKRDLSMTRKMMIFLTFWGTQGGSRNWGKKVL